MLQLLTCCFNAFEHNMCTVVYTTLCKVMCSLYKLYKLYGSLRWESLEINSVHVQCSNVIFATYSHTQEVANVISLLLL